MVSALLLVHCHRNLSAWTLYAHHAYPEHEGRGCAARYTDDSAIMRHGESHYSYRLLIPSTGPLGRSGFRAKAKGNDRKYCELPPFPHTHGVKNT